MISTLILAAALTQTVGVRQQADKVTLTSGQRTTLGNHITGRWGASVPLASVLAFDCSRDRLCVEDGTPQVPHQTCAMQTTCNPTASQAQTAAAVFALLRAGQTVAPGQVSGEQTRVLPGLQYSGAQQTSLLNFLASLWPSVSGTWQTVHCQREGADVTCQATYCGQLTQAQAYSLLQSGQTLVPCSGD